MMKSRENTTTITYYAADSAVAVRDDFLRPVTVRSFQIYGSFLRHDAIA